MDILQTLHPGIRPLVEQELHWVTGGTSACDEVINPNESGTGSTNEVVTGSG